MAPRVSHSKAQVRMQAEVSGMREMQKSEDTNRKAGGPYPTLVNLSVVLPVASKSLQITNMSVHHEACRFRICSRCGKSGIPVSELDARVSICQFRGCKSCSKRGVNLSAATDVDLVFTETILPRTFAPHLCVRPAAERFLWSSIMSMGLDVSISCAASAIRDYRAHLPYKNT